MVVAGQAPTLTAPLQDMTVESDRPVELTCQYQASPTPTVQWFRETALIKPSTDFQVGHPPIQFPADKPDLLISLQRFLKLSPQLENCGCNCDEPISVWFLSIFFSELCTI